MRADQIKNKLSIISKRLTRMERNHKAGFTALNRRMDDLLKIVPLPNGVITTSSEQRTINALIFQKTKNDREWNDATRISIVTGMSRAEESGHLNDLVRKGIAERKPIGRTVLFRLRKME